MVCSSVSISPAHVIIIITTVSMTYHLQLSVQSSLVLSATVHCQQFFVDLFMYQFKILFLAT